MSKKKGKRKSDKNSSMGLEKIVLITAILNLICEVIELIKDLT